MKIPDIPLDEIPTIFRNRWGTVTGEGPYQAWRQFGQWHVRRIGDYYSTATEALHALNTIGPTMEP